MLSSASTFTCGRPSVGQMEFHSAETSSRSLLETLDRSYQTPCVEVDGKRRYEHDVHNFEGPTYVHPVKAAVLFLSNVDRAAPVDNVQAAYTK